MKLMYTINQTGDRHYRHIELTVMPVQEEDSRYYSESLRVSFTWQSDRDRQNEQKPWYAGRAHVQVEFLEQITFAQKILKKVLGDNSSDIGYLQPTEVIAKLKAVRVVKDPRISEYVRIEELIDPAKQRYMDDYNTLGTGHCHYDCVASSETEAKKLILVEASKKCDTNFIQSFITAGSPVMVDTWCQVRDINPTEEILIPQF